MTAFTAHRDRLSAHEAAHSHEGQSGARVMTAERLPAGLPAEVTSALASLWTQYAGKRPTDVRTEIQGNVLTCVLVDAVGDFDRRVVAPQTRDTVRGVGKLTSTAYKREAVAAVVRLTRQRVASYISSHDRDTDVATEVFTLEASLSRGAPRAERRFRQASWPPPVRAQAGLSDGLSYAGR